MVCKDFLQAPSYKHMLDPYVKTKKTSYEVVPLPILGKYQAIDTCNTSCLRLQFTDTMSGDPPIESLYRDVLIPASEMLTRAELRGLYVDTEILDANEDRLTEEIDRIEEEIREIIGHPGFNPGSWQQVQRVLYSSIESGGFGFTKRVKTAGTDKKTIGKLQEAYTSVHNEPHRFLSLLQRHRKIVKQRGTYVRGCLLYTSPSPRD